MSTVLSPSRLNEETGLNFANFGRQEKEYGRTENIYLKFIFSKNVKLILNKIFTKCKFNNIWGLKIVSTFHCRLLSRPTTNKVGNERNEKIKIEIIPRFRNRM